MSDEMTGVYSGGLMYEYSLEDNDYGIVKIRNGKVEHQDEFDLFKAALEQYSMPTGDGGAAKESHSVDCPAKSDNWPIDSDTIPEMPAEAQQYMEDGAGEGPGLNGSGSQQAGDSGTATASVSEGQASPTAGSQDDDEEDAAMSLRAASGAVAVAVLTLFGSLLL
jgi:1,3-beta-glucanosyltransferase GAS5